MNDNPKNSTTHVSFNFKRWTLDLVRYRNVSVPSLIEVAIHKKEEISSSTGALAVRTGKFTGKSPDDRYIVHDNTTHSILDWGKANHPISQEKFEKIFKRMKKHIRIGNFLFLMVM